MWPFHRHTWEARDITKILSGNGLMPQENWSKPETDILYVCTLCGDSKVERRNGHWNLEDLKSVRDN